MKRCSYSIAFVLLLALFYSGFAFAETEFQVQNTINMDKKPLDIAISERSFTLYVLTTDGIVNVYDSSGILKGQVEVGKHIDGIAPGPSEDIFIAKSKKEKTVQYILIEFVYDINIEGSPYKGNADAPVVITVFTDYQ